MVAFVYLSAGMAAQMLPDKTHKLPDSRKSDFNPNTRGRTSCQKSHDRVDVQTAGVAVKSPPLYNTAKNERPRGRRQAASAKFKTGVEPA